MSLQTLELTVFEKLFKKYVFTTVQKVMQTRPEWDPKVGLTVHGTTWIYLLYNPGNSEHYWERLACRGLSEQIIAEFRKRDVKIHT